jgi:hypothetical protein
VVPGNSWGRGAGWSRVEELIELARMPDGSTWTRERRARIFQQVMARLEKERERRRVFWAFAAGAATALIAGLLVMLLNVATIVPIRVRQRPAATRASSSACVIDGSGRQGAPRSSRRRLRTSIGRLASIG